MNRKLSIMGVPKRTQIRNLATTYQLPADNVVLSSCGEPTDGTMSFDGTCVTYDPNTDFLGLDSMCVSVCDTGC